LKQLEKFKNETLYCEKQSAMTNESGQTMGFPTSGTRSSRNSE
jgi:hypothetical protein